MTTPFRYSARDGAGKLIHGIIESDSAQLAAQILTSRGLTPIDITLAPQDEDFLRRFRYWRAERTLGLDDLILFSRQMYSLTKAGVPLLRAIPNLADTCRNLALQQALLDITRKLEAGQSLSQALARHETVFPILLISILHVGETTGNLDQAFLQISRYLEREKDTQNRIKAALRYPSMVLFAIAIALTIVNIYVIPAFKGVFDKLGANLPWQTRLLISVSDFFVQYWPYLLSGVIALLLIIVKYLKSETGLMQWHRLQLKIPVVGSIIERAILERFSRSFAMVLDAGVPLIQGIALVARAVGNHYIGSKLHTLQLGIEKGDSISRMARNVGLFPPLVLQMITVGEETGNLGEMLNEVADFYEGEINEELKNLSSVIEPILIVIIGIMVLVLALGIFLPMWDLSTQLNAPS